MTQEERENLTRLLQSSLGGIETKRIIERLRGKVMNHGDLIQIDKECNLDETGGIKETDIFNIKIYACGCRADGRKNFGGIDFKNNVVCVRHFYRCIRCRKPLSILTVKPIKGIAYCPGCSRLTKVLKFLGLKK